MNPLPFTETSPSRGTKIDVELKAADEVEESKTQMHTGEFSLWKIWDAVRVSTTGGLTSSGPAFSRTRPWLALCAHFTIACISNLFPEIPEAL